MQVRVLDPVLLAPWGPERFIALGRSHLTWAQIDGRPLQSRTGELPADHVCGVHATVSIKVGCSLPAALIESLGTTLKSMYLNQLQASSQRIEAPLALLLWTWHKHFHSQLT